MALVALQVRVHRRLVRSNNLCRTMAGGAIPADCMVLFMAAVTTGSVRRRREADRRLVALHAADLAVRIMIEVHLPRPQAMTEDRNLNGHRPGISELGFLVTNGAVTGGRTLVMADLTPAGRLKCQAPSLRAEIVAGEAGESAMALVGEGVAGGGRCCDASPRWIVRGRYVSPAP
jgi:hypothetical protein